MTFSKATLYLPFLFTFLLFNIAAIAQVSIAGKVINEQTGSPVQGASVYFNNTSIGTNTNAAGQFSLQNSTVVNAELIISCVGYELLVFKIDAATIQNKNFTFKLNVKEQQLRDVLILTDAVRKKYLGIFEKNFLGITEEAIRSTIENRKDIYFTKGEEKNSFKAYSDTPLVIINKMLGYKISFELIEFSFDEQSGRTYFFGYTRYEEMGDKSRWVKNRKRCYYGSTVHFYRSLIANRLKEEGYTMYLIKQAPFSSDNGSSGTAENLHNSPIAQQEPSMAVTISAEQVIKPDSSNSNNYNITPGGKLMVQYDKDPSSKNYLKDKIMIAGGLPVGFRSYIAVNAPFISLNKTGIVNNPMDLEYSGFWMYEKAANMLPFNYQP
jgi:hypothetical protein